MNSYSVSVPVDDDGYLRRECPTCERQFKWHVGPTGDRPSDATDLAVYSCPLCGENAEPDQWWTQEQLDYVQAAAAGPIMEELNEELRKALSGSYGLFEVTVESDRAPGPPAAIHEPNDLVIVQSPCHPWEPVKIPDDWNDTLHCLICGAEFAI